MTHFLRDKDVKHNGGQCKQGYIIWGKINCGFLIKNGNCNSIYTVCIYLKKKTLVAVLVCRASQFDPKICE